VPEKFDYNLFRMVMDILQIVGLLAVAIYAWITSRHKANADAIGQLNEMRQKENKEIRAELNEIDDRVIKVEEGVSHLPTHDDVTVLHQRVSNCAQEITKLDGTLIQVNNNVQMISSHLLNKGQ
jgi:Protein of unknown function (DUF2730)